MHIIKRFNFNDGEIPKYHVIKKQNPLPVIVPNAGGQDTTDWIDTNADGLADNWNKNGVAIPSIVTGNGFIGNAQRLDADGYLYSFTLQDKTYTLSFKYRSSGQFQIYYFGTVFELPENTGDAVYFEITRTLSGPAAIRFYSIGALDWYEIDEINVLDHDNYNVLKQREVTLTWETLTDIPSDTVYNGVTRLVHTGDDYIYSGGPDKGNEFWRYSISGDSWTEMANSPTVFDNYTSAVYTGGDHIFVSKGDGFKTFWRYTISTNSWDTMADAPFNFYLGHDLTYDGGDDIYCRQGFYPTVFRYSISGNFWYDWTSIAQAPGGLNRSVVLRINKYIYFPQGDTNTVFWRYSIPDNTWDTLAPTLYNVGAGSAMATSRDGWLYMMVGNNTNNFIRYHVGNNIWEDYGTVPENVNWGGSMIYANGYLFARPGNGSLSFWKRYIG